MTIRALDAGRALVIGGSMSGLFAALSLRHHGWTVDIFERVDAELAGRGAGIVAQPQLRDVFARIGLDPAVDLGVEVERRRILDLEGRVVGECECPQTLTSWDHVYRLLREKFPSAHYHRGRNLEQVDQQGGTVIARFSDGSVEHGDLLVGADGLRSTVRQLFLPDLHPLYVGYTAWRGLVDEAALPAAVHHDLFAYLAFCLPAGEQMLGYPVAGPDNDLSVGRRRYNFVWYRPADEDTELPRLLTDASGLTHAISIPPPLINPQIIQEMRADAERVVAPQFRAIIRLCAQPFLQPIYDLEVPHMAFGRVAIVGDAAFVGRPHVAAGVAKAAEDALALAEALSETGDVERGLAHFEQSRIGVGRRIIERARHLGAYMQARQHTADEKLHAARHRTPEAVMTETAVLDFLYQ